MAFYTGVLLGCPGSAWFDLLPKFYSDSTPIANWQKKFFDENAVSTGREIPKAATRDKAEAVMDHTLTAMQ